MSHVDERATVGGIFRLAARLALAWGIPPSTVLFVLAMEAPDEAAFGRLVSRIWERLPASSRAHLNALSCKETA